MWPGVSCVYLVRLLQKVYSKSFSHDDHMTEHIKWPKGGLLISRNLTGNDHDESMIAQLNSSISTPLFVWKILFTYKVHIKANFDSTYVFLTLTLHSYKEVLQLYWPMTRATRHRTTVTETKVQFQSWLPPTVATPRKMKISVSLTLLHIFRKYLMVVWDLWDMFAST